jgi:hypothetical protein
LNAAALSVSSRFTVIQINGEVDVNEPSDERWKALCRQAADEKDPEKVTQLVREIGRLLDAQRNTNGHKKHLSEIAAT